MVGRTSWCFLPARPYQVVLSLRLFVSCPFFVCGCAYVCDCAAQAEPLASRAPTKYKTFYLRLSRGLTWSPNGKHRHKDKLYNCSLKREERQIGKYTHTDALMMHTRRSLSLEL